MAATAQLQQQVWRSDSSQGTIAGFRRHVHEMRTNLSISISWYFTLPLHSIFYTHLTTLVTSYFADYRLHQSQSIRVLNVFILWSDKKKTTLILMIWKVPVMRWLKPKYTVYTYFYLYYMYGWLSPLPESLTWHLYFYLIINVGFALYKTVYKYVFTVNYGSIRCDIPHLSCNQNPCFSFIWLQVKMN